MQFQLKLFALLLTVVLFACKQKHSSTKIEVEGEIKNLEAMMAQFPGMFPTMNKILIALAATAFAATAWAQGASTTPADTTSATAAARTSAVATQPAPAATASNKASASKKSTTKHKKKVKKSASHTDSVKVKAAQ